MMEVCVQVKDHIADLIWGDLPWTRVQAWRTLQLHGVLPFGWEAWGLIDLGVSALIYPVQVGFQAQLFKNNVVVF